MSTETKKVKKKTPHGRNINDINVKGWHSLKVNFKIVEIQVANDVRMAKCIDEREHIFYLEIDRSILPFISSSDIYYDIAHANLMEIVRILHNTKNIFTLEYTSDGIKKNITGTFISKNEFLGNSVIYSLKDGGEYIIDNRNILSLIVENVKYYAYEQEQEADL
jgi:hypothetical protein